MKRVLVATALAIFGMMPAIGTACEYNDDSTASAAPSSQLGLASSPAASTVPAPTVAKALTVNAGKPSASKTKPVAPDRKVAVVTSN